MSDRSVNSYDLNEARLILSALAPTPSSSETVAGEPMYVRLAVSASPASGASNQEPVAAVAPADFAEEIDTSSQKFSSWEACLTWCLQAVRAEAAFVVDSQGFIIASRGRVPGQGFEGAGAELVCSVEQLERIEPEAGRLQWVDLDFDKRRIVGFITPSESAEYYAIGLIGPDPGYHAVKQVFARQIIDNLPNLD